MGNIFVLIVFAVIVGIIVAFTQPFASDVLDQPAAKAHNGTAPSNETNLVPAITRTPTEDRQALWVAEQLGGTSAYYFPQGSGWAYNSLGEERVTFTVPKGAVVDTTRGLRYTGDRVSAREFTIWF